MSFRRFIFHPLIVLLLSLTGGLVYATWASWRFSGDNLSGQYLYVVPIVVPFVAFLLDRLKQLRETTVVGAVVDVLVVGTAMMRVIGDVPYVSGHALFLTYAVFRPGSPVTRITAAGVMVEVIYLKFFVWHDFITPTTGVALAVIAALITRRFGSNPKLTH
ncbi:MAG: hypothetical protein M3R68_10400 [Acidobacteriota bacterium]|nr:hypothetical protein [Acidobacteriota bacterium]